MFHVMFLGGIEHNIMLIELGAEYAQVCAIKFGIGFALEHGFNAATVESDCKGVVDVIARGGSFQSFDVVHIGRKANTMHDLSKFALSHANCTCAGVTPYCIQQCVLKDIMSMSD